MTNPPNRFKPFPFHISPNHFKYCFWNKLNTVFSGIVKLTTEKTVILYLFHVFISYATCWQWIVSTFTKPARTQSASLVKSNLKKVVKSLANSSLIQYDAYQCECNVVAVYCELSLLPPPKPNTYFLLLTGIGCERKQWLIWFSIRYFLLYMWNVVNTFSKLMNVKLILSYSWIEFFFHSSTLQSTLRS